MSRHESQRNGSIEKYNEIEQFIRESSEARYRGLPLRWARSMFLQCSTEIANIKRVAVYILYYVP